MHVEFWGCHSRAQKGRSGEWTCLLVDGMARRWTVDQAFSARTKAERLHAVLCIHVLKNPQGAIPNAQNSAFLNHSPDMKQGLTKRSLEGFVAHPKPNIGRPAPPGTEINEIITEGVEHKTKCKQWQMGGYLRGTHRLQSQRHRCDCRRVLSPQGTAS